MKTEKTARRPQKGLILWMKTRKIARRPQKGLILWTNLRHCRGNCNVACICTWAYDPTYFLLYRQGAVFATEARGRLWTRLLEI